MRGLEQLKVFSLLEQACQPELVLHGTNEILARALHRDYLANLPAGSQHPAAVAWDDLPRELKESNRAQAAAIAAKLEAVGYHIVPLTEIEAASFTFTEREVERLAAMEHERWVSERRMLGWTKGPRDVEKKTNPYLVSWDELDEEARNMNRNSITQLPRFLNRAGFTAQRVQV